MLNICSISIPFLALGALALQVSAFDTGDTIGSDADGKTDIFWQNVANQSNLAWFLDNDSNPNLMSLLDTSDTMPSAPSSYQMVATADFNKDGHTDILWRNPTSGANIIWYMSGVTVS